jgi:hypothetical protein
VLAVAAVAIADGLRSRGGEETSPPVEETATTDEATETAADQGATPALVSRLRAEGLTGRLVLVGRDCRPRAVELPSLEAVETPPVTACAAPSPTRLEACDHLVTAPCPARVRPGGSVVVVRDGGLWSRAAECPRELGRCWEELLSRDDLRRLGVPEPRIVDHVWPSAREAAVLLAWPGGGYVLGLYDGRALVASHRWGGEAPPRLEAAPGGTLLAARPARLFRGDGTPVVLAPRFRNARSLAWSPDGRWTALAMVGAAVLVPTQALVGGADAHRAIRLPFPADDLAWLEP